MFITFSNNNMYFLKYLCFMLFMFEDCLWKFRFICGTTISSGFLSIYTHTFKMIVFTTMLAHITIIRTCTTSMFITALPTKFPSTFRTNCIHKWRRFCNTLLLFIINIITHQVVCQFTYIYMCTEISKWLQEVVGYPYA